MNARERGIGRKRTLFKLIQLILLIILNYCILVLHRKKKEKAEDKRKEKAVDISIGKLRVKNFKILSQNSMHYTYMILIFK